jgi:hypothetical protein
MLDFLVLGYIPGTAIQITFNWFLIVSIVAGGTYVVSSIYKNRRLAYQLRLSMVLSPLLFRLYRQYTLTK